MPLLNGTNDVHDVPHDPQKPTVYLIDPTFNSDVIPYARSLFNLIIPTDPESRNWKSNATALLVRSTTLSSTDIAAVRHLRAIGKQGVGIDNIDQSACAARDIRILNTPGANANAVAELTLTLALAVARQIRSITVRQMDAPVHKTTCSGLTLRRKTLGVVGMGNIGTAVARMFRGAFEVDLIAFDPYVEKKRWADIPHRRAGSLEEVLVAADVLTLHLPLNQETRDMIMYAELKKMKKQAILINAARGGIVNEKDLVRALREGLLWGAGVDCHEEEPPSTQTYGNLWENLNVISTPHIGAATKEAQVATAKAAIDNLWQYLTQGKEGNHEA